MPNQIDPELGQWYTDRNDQPFEVINVDTVNKVIDIQSIDGSITEIDAAHWPALDIEPIDCPMAETAVLEIDAEQDDLISPSTELSRGR